MFSLCNKKMHALLISVLNNNKDNLDFKLSLIIIWRTWFLVKMVCKVELYI